MIFGVLIAVGIALTLVALMFVLIQFGSGIRPLRRLRRLRRR